MQTFTPGPNNEIIVETPRDTTIRFPVLADTASYAHTASFLSGYIESASYAKYAETSSFSLGFILSASYANFASTASYLLGSVANAVSCSWAALAGHALTAETASYAIKAETSFTATSSVSSSYATTASWVKNSATSSVSTFATTAATASYTLSSSFSQTSVSSSYAIQSATASYLNGTASNATNAVTASFLNASQVFLNVSGSTPAQMEAHIVTNIVTATIIDSFPTTSGLSAKWLLSINDGSNFKTSEILAIWNPNNNTTNFAEVTTNVLGTIPVAMSVSLSSGLVRLVANPSSGTWTVKLIKFLL